MITHEIIGDDMQAVVLTMARGDVVRAEAGAMMYMTDGIDMDAKMSGGLLRRGLHPREDPGLGHRVRAQRRHGGADRSGAR
jgi:uncharacterized protein (AIM24 family)